MTDVPVARAFDVDELAGLPADSSADNSADEQGGDRGRAADRPPDAAN